MKPILMTADNLYLDTTLKLLQSWWLMWCNLFMLKPHSFKEQAPTIIVMPVFLNVNNPY